VAVIPFTSVHANFLSLYILSGEKKVADLSKSGNYLYFERRLDALLQFYWPAAGKLYYLSTTFYLYV